MRFLRMALVTSALAVVACSDNPGPTQPDQVPLSPQPGLGADPSRMHIMRPRGVPLPGDRVTATAATLPITYHGGPVMHNQKVAAIYWATSQIYTNGPLPGSVGSGSQDNSLVGYFLRNLGGSSYFNINTTYFDIQGRLHFVPVTNSLAYTQFWADNTNVPSTSGTAVSEATIRAEIEKAIFQGKLVWDANTIYVVFTAGKTNLGGGTGTDYCAYHSTFLVPGIRQRVTYAVLPYVAAYPGACTTGYASPNADYAADNEVNVLAHEIEESVTDPVLNAWYDADGNENADKCAWQFPLKDLYTTSNGGKANMKIGTKDFLIQPNWVANPVQACALKYP